MELEIYYKIGYVENGEALYQNSEGEFAVEKDYYWLVSASDEELAHVRADPQ